jgi:AcrR family transcriptional regulator
MPPIVDKEKKISLIAEAALKVFQEKSFHRTKMADIAAAADVGKGTLYEYFRNKQDILKHIYQVHLQIMESPELQQRLAKPRPAERLAAFLEYLNEHLLDWEGLATLFLDYYSVARTEDELMRIFVAAYEDWLKALTAMIQECQRAGEARQDIDAESAAKIVLSLYDGLMLYSAVTSRPSGNAQHAATFTRLFKDSLELKV